MISVEFLTKLTLKGETNIYMTCTTLTVMSQCNHFVVMVINHQYEQDIE